MMRLSALTGLFLLTACAGFPALPYTPPTYFAYRCDAGSFEMRLGDDTAFVLWDGKKIALPHMPAASGTKFGTDDGYRLWFKGQEAMFRTPDFDWRACSGELVDTPWRAAAVRGARFRAVGNEPAWLLEIHPEFGGVIVLGYGETILHPTPDDAVTFPEPITVGGRRFDFTILHDGCRDVMSGKYMPLTVVMTVDGMTYRGCGRSFN